MKRAVLMDVDQQRSIAGQGKPIIVPSQDIVLGLYYLSIAKVWRRRARAVGVRLDGQRSRRRAGFGHCDPCHAKYQGALLRARRRGRRRPEPALIDHDAGPDEAAGDLPHTGTSFCAEPGWRPLPRRSVVKSSFDEVYRPHYRAQKAIVSSFCGPPIMHLGFRGEAARAGGISFGKDEMAHPRGEGHAGQRGPARSSTTTAAICRRSNYARPRSTTRSLMRGPSAPTKVADAMMD